MMNAMMGERTVLVNAVNLGSLNAPRPPAAADQTVAELEAAANKNPTAEAWYKLGEALRKAGQQEKAAAAYRNALLLRPNYPDAARALAELKK
jgi:cytochrome c-type biogenesis protein CcmH/NrfG